MPLRGDALDFFFFFSCRYFFTPLPLIMMTLISFIRRKDDTPIIIYFAAIVCWRLPPLDVSPYAITRHYRRCASRYADAAD